MPKVLCKTASVGTSGLASCAVLLVAGLGACEVQRDCTAMGMSSGVVFKFPVDWVVDEMCVNGVCQTPIG